MIHLPIATEILDPTAHALSCLAETRTEWGQSRFSEYRRCQLSHALKYGADAVAESGAGAPIYFAIGRLLHASLAHWQEGARLSVPTYRWNDVLVAASGLVDANPSGSNGLTFEALDLVHELAKDYEAHWGSENAGWPGNVTHLGCEILLEADIGGTPYTARADHVIEIGGEILIVDSKTRSAAPPRDYTARMATRPQFLGLSWLAKRAWALDYLPRVVINTIVKTTVPKFSRHEITLTQSAVDAWHSDHEAHVAQGFTGRIRNYSECAPDYGGRGKCWAFGYCHNGKPLPTKITASTTEESEYL